MKKGFVLFFCLLLVGSFSVQAQTVEELTEQRAAKQAELETVKAELDAVSGQASTLEAEIASLTEQITPYPRWNTGLLGNVGFSLANFNDWLLRDQPNTSAINIGFTANAFANADYSNSFWRNSANLTLGWLKFDDKDNPDDVEELQVSADAFNFSSLFGYKLNDKVAISTLGEYRTSLLDGRFNNPGYLDLGVGATLTPATDLVVVIHPLNYNFVFSDMDFEFESSLGAKVVADYTRKITEGVAWKSNLSAFFSYNGSDLSNWAWVNTFSTAVKGIGIGLDIGLRSNKQEALAAELTDNPLQTYWLLGLSYAISK